MPRVTKPHLLNSTLWKNKRIGLLGGSFNPPHHGHIHISLTAMKSLKLDFIWWLVSPQNPLKSLKAPSAKERIELCEDLITHPKILVSDLENDMGTNLTYQVVPRILQRFPQTEFAWISGMDNALTMHKWNHWDKILKNIATVFITRDPPQTLVKQCPLRLKRNQEHFHPRHSGRFPLKPGRSYWFLERKIVNVSSTNLRKLQSQSSDKN